MTLLPFAVRPYRDCPLVVAYGLGVDSTARLIEFAQRGVRPDLILFTDSGDSLVPVRVTDPDMLASRPVKAALKEVAHFHRSHRQQSRLSGLPSRTRHEDGSFGKRGWSMIDMKKPLFGLGAVGLTPGAAEALQDAGQSPWEFLSLHASGTWGDDLCKKDKDLNKAALVNGSRILSAYRTCLGVKLWIITEAQDDNGNRTATTILLPDEY